MGLAVPIRPFLDGEAFNPEAIESMGRALADACLALGLKDREDAITKILAMRIIDLAREGAHEPEVLKAAALKGFTSPAA